MTVCSNETYGMMKLKIRESKTPQTVFGFHSNFYMENLRKRTQIISQNSLYLAKIRT